MDETTTDRNGQLRRQKSVTFANVPETNDKPAKKKTPEKKSKGPAKKKKTPPPTDLKPALEYLRLWKTARSSWKFNKNHQTTLIKHLFDADGIPAADIEAFYEYIKDLKGFVRMRLVQAALEVRTRDREEVFPEGTADIAATQERYETVLAKFLQSQQVGCKRKVFAEQEYLSDSDDGDIIIQRLVKRMRAELVIDELSDGDTDMSTTSSVSSKTLTGSNNNLTSTASGDKKVKLNDGTGKRRRKLRTNLDSDSETSSSSSSSDSSSDSDSDTSDSESESGGDDDTSSSGSSSSSSDDSSSEEEQGGANDVDETSSSSSSSSDEADSEDTSDDSDDEDEGDI